jgi:hypothetical protein
MPQVYAIEIANGRDATMMTVAEIVLTAYEFHAA